MDEVPDRQTVFDDLAKETGAGPDRAGAVRLGAERPGRPPADEGAAPRGAGARRRPPSGSARRARRAFVFKVSHGGAMGRLAYARVFGGALKEGAELKSRSGEEVRVGTLFAVQGEKTAKLAEAKAGDVVAIAKLDEVACRRMARRGQGAAAATCRSRSRNYALAIATKDRKDDVRLSTALHKLTEEDRGADLGAGRGDARDPAARRQRRASQGHARAAEAALWRRGRFARRRRSATRNRSARPSPSAAGTRSSRAATASSATR